MVEVEWIYAIENQEKSITEAQNPYNKSTVDFYQTEKFHIDWSREKASFNCPIELKIF